MKYIPKGSQYRTIKFNMNSIEVYKLERKPRLNQYTSTLVIYCADVLACTKTRYHISIKQTDHEMIVMLNLT